MIEHIRRHHVPERGLLVLADHHSCGRNLPYRVGGFLPDVFASDLPATFEILGEAKTLPDLLTTRSHRQITAFLDHLAVRPGSTFYLYVPPFTKTHARSIVNGLLRPAHTTLAIEVLDGT
ncbi:MAG: hypothetical protein ACYC0C_03400 [Devosia sp.]